MELITFIVGILIWLKMWAVINTILWIKDKGHVHLRNQKTCEENCKLFNENDSFVRSGGDFYPFGVKDYKLEKYINGNKYATGLKGCWISLLDIFYKIFRARNLSLIFLRIILIGALIEISSIKLFLFLPENWHTVLLLIVAVCLLLWNILYEIEVAYGYIIFKNYASNYYKHKDDTSSTIESEIEVIIKLGTRLIFTNAFVVAYSCIAFKAFKGICPTYDNWHLMNIVSMLLKSIYFTFTTFTTVGYGDITPRNGWGQLISTLMQIQSMGFLIFILSAFWSTRDRTT